MRFITRRTRRTVATLTLAGALALTGAACEEGAEEDVEDVGEEVEEEVEEGVDEEGEG